MVVIAKCNEKYSTQKFPKLMVYESEEPDRNFVVLFTNERTGTVVFSQPDCPWSVGHYSECWGGKDFDDFKGAITLTNDI